MNTKSSIEALLDSLKQVSEQIAKMDYVYEIEKSLFGEGYTKNHIEVFEKSLSNKLPSDYKEYLRHCRYISAMDIFNGYELYDIELMQRIIIAQEVPTKLQMENIILPLLPIGGDGGGNHFFLSLGANNTIWKWSHELVSEQGVLDVGNLEKGLWLLTDSFTNFLARMLDDWQHFLNNDQKWNYMSG